MSNSLDATDTDSDKFIIGKLPVNSDEVSIMTLAELFNSLKDKKDKHNDVVYSLDDTEYYVYGIAGENGKNSTLEDLQEVGVEWFRRKNVLTTPNSFWINAGESTHPVFGGPLYRIGFVNKVARYCWYYSEIDHNNSLNMSYWYSHVPGDVCVAVVHK